MKQHAPFGAVPGREIALWKCLFWESSGTNVEKIKAEAFTSKSSEVVACGLKLGEIASEQIMLIFQLGGKLKERPGPLVSSWALGQPGPGGAWKALGCP